MTSLKKSILAVLLVTLGAIVGGCSMQPQRDTTIPWSRPADWEGQIPGMGQAPGR